MFPSSDVNGDKQRGDILLESLIGIVLMAVIGLGITYASSRAASSHRDMKLQSIAVGQMRDLLALNGKALCSNSSLAIIRLPTQTAAINLDVSCTDAPAVTMGGRTVTGGSTLGKVVLTTRSSDNAIFGGVIRVGDET